MTTFEMCIRDSSRGMSRIQWVVCNEKCKTIMRNRGKVLKLRGNSIGLLMKLLILNTTVKSEETIKKDYCLL